MAQIPRGELGPDGSGLDRTSASAGPAGPAPASTGPRAEWLGGHGGRGRGSTIYGDQGDYNAQTNNELFAGGYDVRDMTF
jgi:hypothetical protein